MTAFIRDTAADSDKTWPEGLDARLSALANRLQIAIRSANRTLAARAQDDAALDGSGATLAAALFGDGDVAISHVGDCRAYLLRDGSLSQMTRDHSVVAEQMALGLIDAQAARTHPLRHVVTRAVSGQAGMAVDTLELKIEAGDRLLLCSDGIHGVLTDKEIADIVGDRHRPLDELCRAAIEQANSRGGPDNCYGGRHRSGLTPTCNSQKLRGLGGRLPLSDQKFRRHPPAWLGRHGCGVPRSGPGAESRGGHQGHSRGSARPGGPRPLLP